MELRSRKRSRIDTLSYEILHRQYGNKIFSPSRGISSLYSARTWVHDLDIVNELDGHRGCVNALSWSKSGALLASGSDDRDIVIHKYQPQNSLFPFEKAISIATGHTQNIFSVKFMPHSGDRTLVSAAGDSQVRVFDIEYTVDSNHNQYPGSNVRVYKSHKDRVKRIVTEASPHLFLSCSEDGDVRQWDLRQPSSFYPRPSDHADDPPPLISYSRYSLDLNTISCSPAQPHYIALGGNHRYCFLHDRRMLGRDHLVERGQSIATDADHSLDTLASATRCVQKFGPNRPKETESFDHITACKISDARPNELIVSWSGDHIYSFDLRAPQSDPARFHNARGTEIHGPAASTTQKRTRDGSSRSTQPRPRSDAQDFLKIRWRNGQTEYVPITSAEAEENSSFLNGQRYRSEAQNSALMVAETFLKIKSRIMAFDVPLGLTITAVNLRDMKKIADAWAYPLNPDPEQVKLQNLLRTARSSAARAVQFAGIIARSLGAKCDSTAADTDLASAIEYFYDLRLPLRQGPQRGAVDPNERFSFTLIKAIITWTDSGIGALIEVFSRSESSKRLASSTDLPIPPESGMDAVDEYLVPYLEDLATKMPIPNMRANVMELDSRRIIFKDGLEAVKAFAEALKRPFADLSTAPDVGDADEMEGPSDTQSREEAKSFWINEVARGLWCNATARMTTNLVDKAFGGLGIIPGHTARLERSLLLRSGTADEVLDTLESPPESPRLTVQKSTPEVMMPDIDSQATFDPDDASASDSRTSTTTIEQAVGPLDDVSDDTAREGDETSIDDENNHEASAEDEEDAEGEESEDSEDEPLFRSRRRRKHVVEANVPLVPHMQCYKGHCNVKTVKDVNYFGLDDNYVVSGSDDGNLFIWDRKTAKLVNILAGDSDVVNVLQGHPYEPMLAVSGIDNSIKIFSTDGRAREMARYGRGVTTTTPELCGYRDRRRSTSGRTVMDVFDNWTSDIGDYEGHEEEQQGGAEEYHDAQGLESRRVWAQRKQILSNNKSSRRGGNTDAFITSNMLVRLAALTGQDPTALDPAQLGFVLNGNAGGGQAEGCTIM